MTEALQPLGTAGVIIIAVIMLLTALKAFIPKKIAGEPSKVVEAKMPNGCRATLGILVDGINETKKIATETFFEHKRYLKNISDSQEEIVACQKETIGVLREIKTVLNGKNFSD